MKKKRIASLILVLALVLTVFSIGAFATHHEMYQCTGDAVNVRNGPSGYADSYGYLLKNEIFWSRPGLDNYGSFRYGQCNSETNIAKAYGYDIWGYVSQSYLNYIGF